MHIGRGRYNYSVRFPNGKQIGSSDKSPQTIIENGQFLEKNFESK